jgi:outer membrane receptor protein involved in Fe transport
MMLRPSCRIVLVLILAACPPAWGQTPTQPAPAPPSPPETEAAEPLRYEELVVVTAAKTEQKVIDAAPTMSVITSETIQNSASRSYADLLRAVPGMNVSQTSARDINVTSRSSTGTLATSQLALLDGRTLYQDFFGFVMWDFLPVNLDEVRQIEVIRGPASAIWGANALTGVVNVISKSPRELAGTTFNMSAGTFDRSVGDSHLKAGSLFAINGTHAEAVNDRWAYKLSVGVTTQQPFARPVGTINNSFHTPYPPYPNEGTTQPKFDTRVDYDFSPTQKLIVAGGVAGTRGIIHTGIGPFNIKSGTALGYGKVNYSRGGLKANFFVNVLDGDAAALLSRDLKGAPILFVFKNQTYDGEFGNIQAIGTRQVLSYGGNVRHNAFDLSIAPGGRARNEGGGYLQDEIHFSDQVSWVVGGRVDRFDVLDHAVFSPRTTLLLKPVPAHTFRVSFSRGYRAPSLVNNFIDVGILNQIDLGLINPALAGNNFVFGSQAVGNKQLKEESLTAYELAYTGMTVGQTLVGAAFYVNDTKNDILFRQVASYTAAAPPPGWPLPPAVLNLLIANNAFGEGNGLPSVASYRNYGSVRQKGIELSVESPVTESTRVFVNYSYQTEPVATGFDSSLLNRPPSNRFNAGASFSVARYFGNVSLNFTDSAFWRDVLDARFYGTTDSYTMLNAGAGRRWNAGKLITSISVINILNQDIQQHIFGDVIKRQVLAEVRVRF